MTIAQASQPSYEEWAAAYGINGESARENYDANVARIEVLNAEPNQTAIFAVNDFSGMSFDDFAATYLTLKPEHWPLAEKPAIDNQFAGLASRGPKCSGQECNWDVTPVKDQKGCGACWSFAAMAAIEAHHKINTGETVSLSEQQLLDCFHGVPGDCTRGGNIDGAYQVLEGLLDGHVPQDIYTTSSYPYNERVGSCQPRGPASNVKISGHREGGSDSDISFYSSLRSSGPMAVTIFATDRMQHYTSGILRNVATPCESNHAVLVMGFGGAPRDGLQGDYLKIKNNWGPSWGEKGFMRFERSDAGCGPLGIRSRPPVIPTVVSTVGGIHV